MGSKSRGADASPKQEQAASSQAEVEERRVDEDQKKKDEESVKQFESQLQKPKRTPKQLDDEEAAARRDMVPEEVEQFARIGSTFSKMQDFQLETMLRELVAECVAPLREKVIMNNE